jgi:hypothetical protein
MSNHTHLIASIKLKAPKSLPVSTPPLLAYSAKATLCAAGENPALIERKAPERANSIGLCVSAVVVQETMSTNIDTRVRFKSNKGE